MFSGKRYQDMNEGLTNTSGDPYSWINVLVVYDAENQQLKVTNSSYPEKGFSVDVSKLEWSKDSGKKLKLILGGDFEVCNDKNNYGYMEVSDLLIFDKALSESEQQNFYDTKTNNVADNIKDPSELSSYDKVIGWYTFEKEKTTMPNGSGDAEVDVTTVKNKKNDQYLKYTTSLGSDTLVEVSNGSVVYGTDRNGNAEQALDISGTAKSKLGILLDQNVTIEDGYTISFRIKTDKEGKLDGTTDNDANIMYIGPLTVNSSDTKYHEIKRFGKNGGLSKLKDGKNTPITGGQHLRFTVGNFDDSMLSSNMIENGIASAADFCVNGTFNDTSWKTITIIAKEDGTLTIYDGKSVAKNVDGKKMENLTIGLSTEETINLILAGLANDHQQNAKILIDDLYVFDKALTKDERQSLWYFKYDITSIENMETTVAPDAKGAMYDKNGEPMGFYNYGKLSKSSQADRAGWYYVSSSGQYDRFKNGDGQKDGFNTSKQYNGLESEYSKEADDINAIHTYRKEGEFELTDDKRIKVTDYVPSDITAKLMGSDDSKFIASLNFGNNKNRYVTFGPDGDGEPEDVGGVRFYLDDEGRLRCFCNTGNATELNDDKNGIDITTFASYVFVKTDEQSIKTEKLQDAIAQFSASVAEVSPASRVSAVRFSSNQFYPEKKKGDEKELLIMDWTNDPYAITGMLNQKTGIDEDEDKEPDTNGAGAATEKGEYNYYLTGSTATRSGLEAFRDKFVIDPKTNKPYEDTDPDSAKRQKYLIIFTDGNDTDHEDTKAAEVAQQIKDAGYTIFGVLLASDGVNVNDAKAFLEKLVGDNSGTKYTDNVFVFTTKDTVGTGSNEKQLTLTELFEQKIFRKIFATLDDYEVKQYIDPRFNIKTVTDNGDGTYKLSTIELYTEGKIRINGEWRDGKLSDISVVKNTDGVSIVSNTGSVQKLNLNYDLVEKPGVVSSPSDEAYLCYDSSKDMYYVQWIAQNIPSAEKNAEKLAVWRSTVKLIAKDDFIGGNAVLAGGNYTGENYVFYEFENGDILGGHYFIHGSRTNKGDIDDSKIVIDTDTKTKRLARNANGDLKILNYPSKGFPRTAADVKEYDLSNVNLAVVKYLGEDRDDLYTLIEKLADGEVEGVGDSKYFWDYLRRFDKNYPHKDQVIISEADPEHGVSAKTAADYDLNGLIDILANKNNDNGSYYPGGTLTLPYAYLPAKDGTIYAKPNLNSVGTELHKADVIGEITYSFTLNQSDGGSNKYGNISSSQVLIKLDSNEYTLSVSYQPYNTPEETEVAAAAAEPDEEKVPVRKVDGVLVSDDDFAMKFGDKAEDTKTLRTYERLAGTKQEKINPMGVYSLVPVSGAITMQMKIKEDDVKFLQTYRPDGDTSGDRTVTITAELYKEELPVSGPPYLKPTTAGNNKTSKVADTPEDPPKGTPVGVYTGELNISALKPGEAPTGGKYESGYYYVPVTFTPKEQKEPLINYDSYGFPIGTYYLDNIEMTTGNFDGITQTTNTLELTDKTVLVTPFESIKWNVDEEETKNYNIGKANDEKRLVTPDNLAQKNKSVVSPKVEIPQAESKPNNKYGQYYRYAEQAMYEKAFARYHEPYTYMVGVVKDAMPDEPGAAPEGIKPEDYTKYAAHHQDEYKDESTPPVTSKLPGWYLGLSYDGIAKTDALLGAGETTLDVNHVEFDIVKELVGRTWQNDDEFKFDIKLVNGSVENAFVNGKKAEADGTFKDTIVINKDSVVTVDDKDVHKKTVGLSFTADDTYEFVVTEQPNDDYTAENENLNVIVYVEDGKVKTMTVAGTTTSSAMTFRNTYKSSVMWTPKVSKTLEGREFLDSDRFTFTIMIDDTDHHVTNHDFEEVSEPVMTADVDDDNDTPPEGYTWKKSRTITKSSTFNSETGAYETNLPTIQFNKAGTYTFHISEKNGSSSIDGITYSEEEYTVTVDVKADEITGDLYIASVESKNSKGEVNPPKQTYDPTTAGSTVITGTTFAFTNVYDDKAEWTPKVTKEFDEIAETYLTTEEFTFTLTEYSGGFGGVGKEVGIVKLNSSSLTKEFSTITYEDKDAGKHYYTISETGVTTVTDKSGEWTMDKKVYYIVVDVKNDGSGVLEEPNVTVYTDDNKTTNVTSEITEEKGYVFTNTFTPDPVSITPMVKKFVTGDIPNDTEFKFNITGEVVGGTGGKKLSDYYYIIDETDETNETKVTATINVTVPSVNALSGVDGVFPKIMLKKAGTYKFTVTEGNSVYEHITDDATKYELTVVVKKIDNKLEITKTTYIKYTNEEDKAAAKNVLYEDGTTYFEFTNSYDNGKANYDIIVTKKLTGRNWKDSDKFTFEAKYVLGDTDGYTLENSTLTINGDSSTDGDGNKTGTFSFEFTKAGKYVFEISEQLPDGATKENDYKYDGIAYDSTKYTVIFDVVDDDGTLSVTKTVKIGEDVVTTGVEFDNKYDTGEVTWTPKVVKTIDYKGDYGGKYEGDWEFTFNVDLQSAKALDGTDMTGDFGDALNTTIKVNNGSTAYPGLENAYTASAVPISFAQAGIYTFTVTEAAGEATGTGDHFVYDNSVYTVEVTVTDDGKGVLSCTEKITERDGEPLADIDSIIFNNHYVDEADRLKFPFDIVKTIETRKWAEDSFTFDITLFDVDIGVSEDDEAKIITEINKKLTGRNEVIIDKDSTDVNNFSKMANVQLTTEDFKVDGEIKTGDYFFTVTEQNGADATLTYDTVSRNVQIHISKTEGGDYEATATLRNGSVHKLGDGSNAILFTNRHDPADAKWQPSAEKTISGREWIDGEVFDVQLTLDSAEPKDGVNYEVGAQNTVSLSKDNPSASFNVITFTREGEYEFTMHELPGSVSDLAYDSTEYKITVKVELNTKTGDLEATVTVPDDEGKPVTIDNNTFKFTNVQVASWKPKVEKVLHDSEANPWTKNTLTSFSFRLEPTEDYENIVYPATVKTEGTTKYLTTKVDPSDEDKIVPFDAIKFKAEGEYQFTISEIVPENKHGYDYDETTYTVTVTVGKDSDGSLTVKDVKTTKKLPEKPDETATINDNTFVFTNIYKPTAIKLKLDIAKEFEGWNGESSEERFNFEVEQVEQKDNPEASIDSSPLYLDKTSEGSDSTRQGSVTITFTKPGTYAFNVREVEGDNKDITYDKNVYRLYVTVADNDGILRINSDKVAIGSLNTNDTEYSVSAADGETTYIIDDYSFKFTNTINTEVGWSPKIAKILNGRAMTEDDTFTFRIEYSDPDHHITYSEKEPAAANVPMTIANSAGNYAEIDITGPADADTAVIGEFGTFTFDADGDYTFTIRETAEINGSIEGITYSKAVYTVTVHVRKQDDGTLTIDSITDTDTDEKYEDNTFTFINEFKPAEWTPEVTKIIDGRDWTAEDSFKFTIELDKEDTSPDLWDSWSIEGDVKEATANNSNHNAVFNKIKFVTSGTYIFTIKEVEPETKAKGMTYDTEERKVSVTVRNVDGVLEATSDPKPENIVFTNVYKPAPTSWTPTATKMLTGDLPKNWEGTFTFSVTEDDKEVSKGTVTMKDTQNVTFGAIEYTEAGVHTYTITENKTSIPGITYSETVYTVTVTVTDAGGALTTKVGPIKKAEKGEEPVTAETIEFVNTYNTKPVDLTIPVTKFIQTSDDLPLPEDWSGEFIFTLKPDENYGDAVVLPETESGIADSVAVTVNNDNAATGATAEFPAITFNKAGEYSFTVTENTTPTVPGIVYDTTTYTFKVTVEDNDAILKVTSISDGINDYTEKGFTFTNEYAPAKWVPVIEKTFDNLPGDWKGGSYTFVLTPVPVDDDGDALTEDKVNIDGIIAKDSSGNDHSFVNETDEIVPLEFTKTYPETGLPDENGIMGSLLFTKEGVYGFTITEKNDPTDLTMTYDTKVYNIRVTVTRNDDETDDIPDGTIVAEVVTDGLTADENAPMTYIFTNKYKPSESETQPSGGETQPSGGETQPSGGETQPSGGGTQPGQTTENTPSVTPGKPHGPEAPKTDPIKLTKTYEGVSLGSLSDNERYQLLSHTRFQISDPMGNQQLVSLKYEDGKAYFSIDRLNGNPLSPNTTYNIIEAEAPEGYERFGRILVKIDENGKVTWSDDEGKTFRPGSIVVKNLKKPAETIPSVPSVPERPSVPIIPGNTGGTPVPVNPETAAPPEEDFGAGAGITEEKEKTDKTVTIFITAAAFIVALGAGSTALRSRKRRKK